MKHVFFSFIKSPGRRTMAYFVIFAIGVGIASFFEFSRSILPNFLFVLAILLPWIFMVRKRVIVCFFLISILWLIGGMVRVLYSIPVQSETSLTQFFGRQVLVRGIVSKEVEMRGSKQRVVVFAESIRVERDENLGQGNVLIWANRWPNIEYGDKLEVSCVLEAPKSVEDFRYDKYLAKENIYTQCTWVDVVRVIERDRGNIVFASVFKIKHRLSSTISRILPEPHASFLAGILYGERTSIPENFKQAFRKTGTTHILAISGYNITIMVVTLTALLVSLYIPRKKAIWLVFLIVALFVILVGGNASVLRAGIMGVIPLFSRVIGRLTHPAYLLIFTGFVMIFINPLVLLFDPGFQLSFAATFGLISLTPLLLQNARWLPDGILSLRETAIATLAAIIFTLPLILFHFKEFSLVALPTNVLILAVIPLAMAFGFTAAIIGIFSIEIGTAFGIIPYAILSYVLGVIEVAQRIPFASIKVGLFNEFALVVSYLILGVLMIRPWRYIERGWYINKV